jgi:hypothetical protein
MSRTSAKRVKEAVWVPCPIPGFTDEKHLIKPSTRAVLNDARDKSMVREWERGQIVHKQDDNLLNENFLNDIWVDWEGVGIEHEDGRIEDPAPCTPQNKLELVNARPVEFVLWLQQAATELASSVEKATEQQRSDFRAVPEVSPRSQESGLHGLSDPT